MTNFTDEAHRLHPRLRVIGNGSGPVNACRSKISTQVSTGPGGDYSVNDVEDGTRVAALQTGVQTLSASALGDANLLKKSGLSTREKLEDSPAADASFVNVLIDVVPAGSDEDDTAAHETVERVSQLL